jgi:hypothetical protein
MSKLWRILVTVSLCIVPAYPVFPQVSFFQPPTFQGMGNVMVADFNRDGKGDILTEDFNLDQYGRPTVYGTLQFGSGSGGFGSTTIVPGYPLLVADFNGDGIPDILEYGSSVLLGNGDGTFQAGISSLINTNMDGVAAGNLNGDSSADVVGVSGTSLLVFINNGNGTFAAPVAYNLGTSSTIAPVLAPGDFNGDGKTDIAVGISGQEIVFLRNGDGTFKTAGITSPNGLTIHSAAVGDFNGDGREDLAVSGSGGVSILIGNGNGTFAAPGVSFGLDGPLVAADVNSDGKWDLLTGPKVMTDGFLPFSAGDLVQIFLGNGDGTFINASNYGALMYFERNDTGTSSAGIAVADFDGDGKLDIAVGGGAILLGNGDGTFQGVPAADVPTESAVVGSFGQNHAPAIAALSGAQLSIVGMNGSYALSLIHTYALPQSGNGIVAADFNGDGFIDLAVVGTDSQNQNWNYSVLLESADGSFQAPMVVSQPGALTGSIVVGDFNNDHKPDLVLGAGGQLAVLLGKGDGTFGTPVYSKGFLGSLIADFNGDGILDIAASQGDSTVISYGNGDGTFQPPVYPASLSYFSAGSMADVNNDGKADLIRRSCTNCYGTVALGNGDGTFTLPGPFIQTGESAAFHTSAVADLNGDGNTDYLTSSVNYPYTPFYSIGLGNGDGGTGGGYRVGFAGDPGFPADVNGDGRPDFVRRVAVVLNTTATGPGFGLFASNLSPATVTPGSSATSTVGVFPFFGFQSSVSLSCNGLPMGASCAFDLPTIDNASGTSTLTITTSASTPTGTYPIQVQGGSEPLSKSAPLLLVVRPDFKMGPDAGSPTSQTISAGQTASFTLVLAPVGSFNEAINLSCAITPAVTPAPTCSLSKSSIQIVDSSSQSITVTVGTTAPATSSMLPFTWSPIRTFPLAWKSIVLGSGLLLLSSRKRRPSLALLILVGLTYSVACGGSRSSIPTQGTPSGTYNVTVTAVAGPLNHNVGFQVVVQ